MGALVHAEGAGGGDRWAGGGERHRGRGVRHRLQGGPRRRHRGRREEPPQQPVGIALLSAPPDSSELVLI